MSDSHGHYPCNAQRLRELYEQLREQALDALDKPASAYGLGVIVLKGMPAWVNAASQYAALESQPDNNGQERTIRLETVEKTQLQRILADVLVQHCHREVSV